MKIAYIRHAKVSYKWKMWYNSKTFDLACNEYDHAPIEIGFKIECMDAICFTSNLLRTEETLKNTIGNRTLIKTDQLNEIPLRSFIDTKLLLPTILWMIIGRLQWYFNSSRQPEGREKSIGRITMLLDDLQRKGEDCVLVGHGFYFAQMVTELKRRGASGNMTKRLKNSECRVFTL